MIWEDESSNFRFINRQKNAVRDHILQVSYSNTFFKSDQKYAIVIDHNRDFVTQSIPLTFKYIYYD